MNHSSKINKYLPSKKFTIITISVFTVLMIIFFVGKWIQYRNTPKTQNTIGNSEQILTESSTLSDLVTKDSDLDGIPDWEESLWGLDPNNKYTNEGISDADWVAQKKKELAASSENDTSTSTGQNLSETDKFSREFFTTITTLKQSGNLDQSAVSNIANVVGDKMGSSNLPNNYRVIDLKKTYDVTIESQAKFYTDVSDLYTKYREQGLGTELDNMDTSTGEENVPQLLKISQIYIDFSKDIMNLSIPNNLTQSGLDIANGAYNTGLAIKNLAQLVNDPLIGLIGLTQYQKWSEQFIRSSEDLETYLVNSSIIK